MKLSTDARITRSLRRFAAPSGAFLLAAGCGGLVAVDEATGTTHQAVVGADAGPDAGLITISGTVVESDGYGVSGVTISLSGNARTSQVTNEYGAFSFAVKPGSYSLTAAVTPGVPSCLAFSPSVINLNNITTSQTETFIGSGNDPITNCYPAPNTGATSGSLTISGKVTSGGLPVAGVKVGLTGSTQATRISDETGAYAFSVNPGSYSLNLSQACASFAPRIVNMNNITTSQTENFVGSKCPPAPLEYCPTFDTLFGFTEPASCATVTTFDCAALRFSLWISDIQNDFMYENYVDCRFGQWNNAPIVNLFTDTVLIQWSEQVNLFVAQLFGCELANVTPGPLAFPLVPQALASLPFTTADLAALSQEFVVGINQALSDNGSPALTAAQTAAINAQLAYAASTYTAAKNSPNLTYSTCPVDAGTQ
jgi:hypothetical protein